jgi:hypothetical protein
MRRRLLWMAVAGLTLGACGGGGSPSQPATPAPVPTPRTNDRPLEFVKGDLHSEKVAGLKVVVGGVESVTDASGRLAVTVTSGTLIETRGHPGYWDRRTRYEPGIDLFPLWPLTDFDADYYKKLVYDSTDPAWDGILTRPEPGTYTVSIAPAIRDYSPGMDWIEQALAEATRLTRQAGRPLEFTRVESGGQITFDVDPSDSSLADGAYIGVCYVKQSGYVITGARIVFLEPYFSGTNVAVHELGHFLGFHHSRDPGDFMYTPWVDQFLSHWGIGEERAWVMMSQRRPGNRYPDDDPSAVGGRGAPAERVVRCPR